ncbi:MAG: hypothetical protein L6Q83_01175 [Gammaproteobacteria bacterium]|nr:hypothetical protein [Gammaproteobacteria bacterium]
MSSATQVDGVRAGTDLPAPGVLDDLSGAFCSARAALAGLLELMSLEARRAGLALVWMAACGLIAAICMVAAWLGLLAAAAMWTISLGLSPITAVIAIAALNLLAGAALIRVCIGMSEDLRFSATRRQVAGLPPVQSPPP